MQSIEGLYSVGRTPKSVDERVLSNRPRKVHIVIRLWTSGSACLAPCSAAHCCSRCALLQPLRTCTTSQMQPRACRSSEGVGPHV